MLEGFSPTRRECHVARRINGRAQDIDVTASASAVRPVLFAAHTEDSWQPVRLFRRKRHIASGVARLKVQAGSVRWWTQRSRASWRPGRPLTVEKPPLPSEAIFLSRPDLAICFGCHNFHSGK